MTRTALALSCLALLGADLVTPSRGLTASSHAQSLSPSQVNIELQPVLTGLSSPLYLTNARDGSGRLFVVEQPGRIKVLQPGSTTPTVFLDITSRVLSGGERGLLGLAFHPQYTANRRFFVNYTRRPDGATVIAEYRVSASDPNLADAAETVLLVIAQPFANHNGGMIEFGSDGYLHIGMGDGGSANDPGNRAQNINELLGKMLRIDVDRPDGAQPYSSPPDNPFVGAPGRDEIYATGMRNPWRFSFDRVTGELYAGDVGQGAIEEVDIITRGGNYGWRVFEGTRCTNLDPARCAAGGFTAPIAEYNHSGGRCSITGGYVYRGSMSSLPAGAYIYGEYCTGEIFMLQGGVQSLLMDTSLNISSFGEDEAGEIYVVGLGGSIFRIKTTSPPPPPGPFLIEAAQVRRRSTAEVLQPITVKPNGKKFDIVVLESGSPTPASEGATVFVNGVDLNTIYTTTEARTPIFVARLRRFMLAQPGQLVVEVVRTDGTRSNQLTLQVLASPE